MRMEPDLNRFMENTRDESKLREAWVSWHQTVGAKVKPLYSSLVRMLNTGAKQAGTLILQNPFSQASENIC